MSFSQIQPSVGVKAGVTVSGIRGDAMESLNQLLDFANGRVSTTDRTGFFVGLNAAIPVSANVSVVPGIYYTQKGYELRGSMGIKGLEFMGANAKAALQSNYVQVPLLLQGDFGGLQLFAGPHVSYLTSADLKLSAGVLGIDLVNKTMDATDQLNRWDAGITAGVGYRFGNGLNLSASYDYGLMRIDAGENAKAYNRGFQVGLGIQF